MPIVILLNITKSIKMYKFKEDSMKVPAYVWSGKDLIEPKAMQQLKNAASLPFAFHHVALMPDGHFGYGAPIGGVLATKGMVVPNFVGVDIGCGMCAVKTSLTEISTDTLKKILGEIRKVIPVGFKKHKKGQDISLMPHLPDVAQIIWQEKENALKSLGTLGGGNHFIEIQKGSDGHIWIMVHSGSRNLGFKVANHYNKLAATLNETWSSKIPKSWELAFLPVDSEEGRDYITEMQYCVEFALANRRLMMDRIIEVFRKAGDEMLIKRGFGKGGGYFIKFDEMINIAHNYAAIENHFGQNVWVHRKGATKATERLVGIIPGSQGTASYIVKGLGNKESFMSCSHGAGRRMGRAAAKKNLDLKEEQKKLEGIIHSVRNVSDLDEASGAYKDIDEVMANQTDLVEVLVKLTPLAVVKG